MSITYLFYNGRFGDVSRNYSFIPWVTMRRSA